MMNRRDLMAAVPSAALLFSAARAFAQAPTATGKGGMRFKNLGDSNLRVSVVGLGTNSIGMGADSGGRNRRLLNQAETTQLMNAAFDAGITFYDTADVYGVNGGSEIMLGEALKDRRKQVIYATKCGGGAGRGDGVRGGSPAYIRKCIEGSLRRLQTDYIDLYQYHFPDTQTPIAETLGALAQLKKEGKILHIGASNFSAAQVEDAEKASRANGLPRFISLQNQYSLLEDDRAKDVLPLCAKYNIGFIPYSPLASGLLTGKYRRNQPAPEGTRLQNRPIDGATYDKIEKLEAFAKARGHTLLDLAVAGLASQPEFGSVIAGATRPEQVRENAGSGGWRLSAADLVELRKLTAEI